MKVRIGSRGSPLAIAQAEWVAARLAEKNPGLVVEFVHVATTGDRDAQSALSSMGGKGVFVKEIEEALLRKEFDLAVHSLKDMPQDLPGGLCLGPFPVREDNRDAFISRFGEHLHELPRGSTIGTSSPRRQAQIKFRHKRRSYTIEPIRGNVETRLKKLQDGRYDAIVLALAGLKRLGLESEVTQILDDNDMVPSPGQGCLGLELREGDAATMDLVRSIRDDRSDKTSRAERAFLQGVGGDCNVPLGARATVVKDEIQMKAILLDAAGTKAVECSESGPAESPEYVGARLAGKLLIEGGSEILLALETHTG